MDRPVIEAECLAFAYPEGEPVLENISFSVREGERLGIVGANGAGKSTLLLLLAGVMPPSAGRLAVLGIASERHTLAAIRMKTGLVFQNPDDMLFMPTVQADVAFGPASRGLDAREVEARVTAALAATGTSELARRPPWKLSGGEKRAASIASVLALHPAILLLDEPSAGLDPASRLDLEDLIRTLPGTVVVASHDLDLVMDLCERVVVLGGGRVAGDGPVDVVLRDKGLLSANRLELPLRLQACPVCLIGLSSDRVPPDAPAGQRPGHEGEPRERR